MKTNPRKSTKRVLVTGATGFIGSNIVRRLIEKGFQVHIIFRPTSNLARISDLLPNLHQHLVDLSEAEKLRRIVKKIKPQIIFHTASVTVFSSVGVGKSKEIIKTNFLGTVNLISACDEINYQCFVNTGSSSEYGLKNQPMAESNICQPVTTYGLVKLTSTLYCQMIAKIKNKPIITLRLFSPYGPYDDKRRLIPTTVTSALKNQNLQLTRPDMIRDYVYIEDVVEAYLACIYKATNLSGEIFNIGAGKQQKIGTVVEKIIKLTNSKSKLVWNTLSYDERLEPEVWQADLTKTKKKLSWQPQTSFETGLAKTVEWFKGNLNLYA